MITRDFILTGAPGAFRLPPGESRIGSDAACEVCVHGEGILPVHAYLRSDGEKVLIRPATAEASHENGRVAITVAGSLITGPATVFEGQSLSIGAVQLTLLRPQEKQAGLWSRRWLRSAAYTFGGVLTLLALAFVYVRFVYLNEEALKTRFKVAVHEALGRPVEDIEIGGIEVRLLDGRMDISNFKIKERVDFQSPASSYFVQIPRTVFKLDVWPLLKSFGREIYNLDVSIDGDGIQNPELLFERSKSDGSINAGDIFQYLEHSPKFASKLTHIDFVFKLSNTAVRLRDPFTGIAETSVENVELILRQPGPGLPLSIEKCAMNISAVPQPVEKGTLVLTGKVDLLDANCALDAAHLAARDVSLEVKKFDLARIFEHLGYAWEPHDTNLKVVLGRPIQGKFDIAVISARELKLQGSVNSQSLLSIKEEKHDPLGNIPMELKIADLHLIKESDAPNARLVPRSVDLHLESWTDPARRDSTFLTFATQGRLNSSGKYTYSIDLVCGLKELFDTDVGKRLKLDETLGGGIEGHADLIVDASQGFGIDARINGRNTFVMVSIPEDVAKPVGKRRMMKQPLPLSFDCFIDARQAEGGGIAYIDVQRFLLDASSFKAHSNKPSRIDVISADEKIKADAQFQLDLKGRDFCREFAPILSLFGFNKSLDEDFDLKVTVFGRNDIVGVLADGKMSRKWNADPAPVHLKSSLIYNKPARARGEIPYLSLSVQALSEGDKPLDLQVEAHCTRQDGKDIIECAKFNKDGKDSGGPGVSVNADIETLRGRFQPYFEQLLQTREIVDNPKAESYLLALYRGTELKGHFEQQARFKILRSANEGANETGHLDFELKATANVKAAIPADMLSPAKPPAGKNDARPRFEWEEPKLSFELNGSYDQSVSSNPEETDRVRMVNVKRLNVEGSLGHFLLGVKNLDLLALPSIRGAPNKEWTDALAGLTIRGTVSPQATRLMKSLGIVDPEDPVSGTIELEAAYERESDALDFKQFDFHESNGFYLTELSASGTLGRVREISAQLFPTQPNRDSLAARLANWVVRDGADVFFGHLGREAVIHSIKVDAKPFREWLARTFKRAGGARDEPPLFSGILDNVWEPQGVWSADDLHLTRDPNLPNTWRLKGALKSGFVARAPLSGFDGGPPTASFSGAWNVEMGLALNKDNVAFNGDITLDNADMALKVPGLKLDLRKPVMDAFTLELAGGIGARELLPLSFNKFRATGKFGTFEMNRFTAESHGSAMKLGLEKFAFDTTDLKCIGNMPLLDWTHDTFVAHAESPALELGVLPELWALSPNNAGGAGRLKNVSIDYRGGLATLLASLQPALRPKLPPDDPRRFGINPLTDTLDLKGDLEGATINLPDGAVALAGHLQFATSELAWSNCAIGVWHAPQPGAPQSAMQAVQNFSIERLHIKSLDPKLNLRQACSAAGLPLSISGKFVCSNAVDAAQIASLKDALKTLVPDSPLAGAPDFLAAKLTLASLGLKAPALTLAGIHADNLDARDMLFKDLKLSVPQLSATLLGGKLLLEDAEYDFSKSAARIGVAGEFKGLRHTQRLNYTDADLCRLMGGSKQSPLLYALCGKLSAQGPLSGVDFKGTDRLSWNGAQKFNVSNLTISAPVLDLEDDTHPPALPWMICFKHHGQLRQQALARAALAESFPALDLSADGGETPAIRLADGILAGVELYLAKTFGVEAGHFEFEPFTTTARIDKGLAVVEPFELKGTGASEGLELQVRNLKINLADDIFADDVLIFPTSIPPKCQQTLLLDIWPAVLRQAFLQAMSNGKLGLRISGPLAAPVLKFPWAELRVLGRSALFGVDAISGVESLGRAREHYYRVWGRAESTAAGAALLADRFGAGLPGTLVSRQLKDSIVDRAAKVPLKILVADEQTPGAAALTPQESLLLLLTTEPDPPPPLVPPGIPLSPQEKTAPNTPGTLRNNNLNGEKSGNSTK